MSRRSLSHRVLGGATHVAALLALAALTTSAALALLGVTPVRATTLGDDGLHEQEWFALTFKDVAEDLAEASADGKRLVLVFEQAGCVYCTKVHETVLSDPEVVDYLTAHYMVVQYNLYGDEEVIDLDGEVLTEKSAAEKWGVMFTPLWLFLPTEADGEESVAEAAVASMPGAFGKGTFLDLFTWAREEGYDGDEGFQRYHSRRIEERKAAAGGAEVATD